MFVNKVINQIMERFFPSQHQSMVRKWHKDGGDYAFRFNYDLNAESVVFDLGGYEGQWSSDLFARYECPILIFEPVTSFANRISDRFEKNSKIKVYPYGLGGTSRVDEIHKAADGSSIFGTTGIKEKIEIVDVADWIRNNLQSDQDIDLMKVNIEGGEYELLERLIESQMINRIKNIQVQFHELSPSSLSCMEQIKTDLTKTHEPTYQYKFVWENWKRKNIC